MDLSKLSVVVYAMNRIIDSAYMVTSDRATVPTWWQIREASGRWLQVGTVRSGGAAADHPPVIWRFCAEVCNDRPVTITMIAAVADIFVDVDHCLSAIAWRETDMA